MKKRFTEEQVQLYRTGVKLIQLNSFFRPGKPTKNCFIELKVLTPSQFKPKHKGLKNSS